jgi:hypothetical protein
MPPWRNRQRSRPVSGRLPGSNPAGGSIGRWGNRQTRPTLDRDTFQVRSLGGQPYDPGHDRARASPSSREAAPRLPPSRDKERLDPMRRIRVFSVLASVSLLLGLLSAASGASGLAAAAPGDAGARTTALATSLAHASAHPTRLVPAHPSLRVLQVRDVRVVRATGRVVRVRVVPWPGRDATSARTAVSVRPGTHGKAVIELNAFTTSGDGDVEYPTPTQSSGPTGIGGDPR